MKWLLLCLPWLCIVPHSRADSAWDSGKPVREARVDLDGDGRPEHIRLDSANKKIGGMWSRGSYRLRIGSQVIFDNTGYDNPFGFYIANIDRADRYREIVVTSQLGSDYMGNQIFAFIGGKIRRVHRARLADLTFDGRGGVAELFDEEFWHGHERYRLNANHTLTWLPQKFFQVEVSSRLNMPLSLHRYQQVNTSVRALPRGTAVRIIRGDRHGWYEIRASRGRKGWITDSELRSGMSDNIIRAG